MKDQKDSEAEVFITSSHLNYECKFTSFFLSLAAENTHALSLVPWIGFNLEALQLEVRILTTMDRNSQT